MENLPFNVLNLHSRTQNIVIMKFNILGSLFLIICLISIPACTPKKDRIDVTVESKKADTVANSLATGIDTSIYNRIENKPAETPTDYDPDKPKVCSPSFKLLKSPAPTHHVYYVSGFNSGEFKCWGLLEKHGQEICNKKPCQVYYIDAADVSFTTSAPYMDAGTLKKVGVAYFTHDNHFFEIKGSSLWGRTGKGNAYYNTNNHLGG